MNAEKSKRVDIRRTRHRRSHGCWDHLVIAPLWVAFQANLGTLLRTCDAVGACMAVPDTPHYRRAIAHGNTLGHAVGPTSTGSALTRKDGSISSAPLAGRSLPVELADGALPLTRLEPASERTVVLLGHEWHGIPEDQVTAAHVCVEIPMVGRGASLNVAVAGSLVLYRAQPDWHEVGALGTDRTSR